MTLHLATFSLSGVSGDRKVSIETTVWRDYELTCSALGYPRNQFARFMLETFNGKFHGNRRASNNHELCFRGRVSEDQILEAILEFEHHHGKQLEIHHFRYSKMEDVLDGDVDDGFVCSRCRK